VRRVEVERPNSATVSAQQWEQFITPQRHEQAFYAARYLEE